MADEASALLAKVALFSSCSRRELAAIARVMKPVEHEEGTVLAREGESGLGFFVIRDGTARVSVGGRARARLGPGQFFGEISLLDGGPRSATVVAETPVRLYGLTAWSFRQIVSSHPSIAQKLLRILADRLTAASADVRH